MFQFGIWDNLHTYASTPSHYNSPPISYQQKIQYIPTPSHPPLSLKMKIKLLPDLTTDQYNTELAEQQKYFTQALKLQDAIINELESYLAAVDLECSQEVQEVARLGQKNQKILEEMGQLQAIIADQTTRYSQLKLQHQQQSTQTSLITTNLTHQLHQHRLHLSHKQAEVALAQRQNTQVLTQIKIVQSKLDSINQQNKKIEKEIYQTQLQIRSLGQSIQECYLVKKKLNNQLQEMRGNIRVYCRIRPFLSAENQEPIYQLLNQNTLKINVPKEHQKSESHHKDYHFNFQQIFGVADTQERIFNQLSQLIQSAVDGKNVCIFAYGQTGSGKTFTMQGGRGYQNAGIIPRSVELIFEEVKRAEKYEWQAEVSVIIQEIYLQNVEDLLSSHNKNPEQAPTKFIVQSPEQIYSILDQATKNRKVAETSCNEHSSRSHLIFRININLRNANNKLEERSGSLNLVDLAGSQRVSLSKVEGDRMKETQAINKSLTNLGLVISALAKKQQHIPFRNSKLTYLLQKYLQGDSKTLMFVNISPKQSDYNQTICSLRFAEKVKECKLKK